MQIHEQIELKLKMIMDRLSNRESVQIDETLIQETVKSFEETLRRQLTSENKDFTLRMSNLGRPNCQLYHEKNNSPKDRLPYNHILRMLIGDAVESYTDLFLKASGLNVSGGKDEVKLHFHLEDNKIVSVSGTSDIDIEELVWDIKSASPFMYETKWSKGFDKIYEEDTFGYCAQLYGYSKAQKKKAGGWIVVNKSSGEFMVVPFTPDNEQLEKIRNDAKETVKYITDDSAKFAKCFSDQDELFYKKKTGNKVLPFVCVMCGYKGSCWPNAQLKPKAKSKAANPQTVWYTEYHEEENE